MDDKILNQNPTPPISVYQGQFKPKNKGKKIILLILVLILIAAAVFMFFYYDDNNKKQEVINEPVLTVSRVRNALLADSKISFPEIEKESVIDAKNISKDIKEIIDIASSTNLEVKEVTYVDGKKGQTIKFNIDKPLLDYYWNVQGKSKSKGWTLLFGSRGILVTILEIENKALTVRILWEEITKESMEIYVQTIQK